MGGEGECAASQGPVVAPLAGAKGWAAWPLARWTINKTESGWGKGGNSAETRGGCGRGGRWSRGGPVQAPPREGGFTPHLPVQVRMVMTLTFAARGLTQQGAGATTGCRVVLMAMGAAVSIMVVPVGKVLNTHSTSFARLTERTQFWPGAEESWEVTTAEG